MVVIQQVFDPNLQLQQPASYTEGLRDWIQNCRWERSRPVRSKYLCSSTRCARDEEFFERLWQREGAGSIHALGGLRQRKRKRDFIRHDGHFTPVPPKTKCMRKDPSHQRAQGGAEQKAETECMRKESSHEGAHVGDEPKEPRCACSDYQTASSFKDCTSGYEGSGACDYLREEFNCGYGCAGGGKGCTKKLKHCADCCCSKSQECLGSSRGLLSALPKKLSNEGGFRQPQLQARRRLPSPCLSEKSLLSSCDSLPDIELSGLVELLVSSSSSPHERGRELEQLENENHAQTLHQANPKAAGQHSCKGMKVDRSQSPSSFGPLYNMAQSQLRRSSQKLMNKLENLTIRNTCRPSQSPGTTRPMKEILRDAHKETIEKAQKPVTATRLDNMKASILCHGFYPRLVDAYIKHRKVGASPEMKAKLEDLQAQMRDWQPSSISNESVSRFHALLTTYEDDLQESFQRSMRFCDDIEKDMKSFATRKFQQACRRKLDRAERKGLLRKPAWR